MTIFSKTTDPLADTVPERRKACSPLRAFTLVEVVLSLGIVSFGLIAVVGLIPVGLSAMKSAVTDTTTSLILLDIRSRMASLPFTPQNCGPYFYSLEGTFVGTHSGNPANLYRVDVRVAAMDSANQPTSTSMLAAVASIAWPVAPDGSVLSGKSNRLTNSFYLTPSAGPSWDVFSASTQRNMDL